MKKNIFKFIVTMIMAVMLVITAIPFVSAATALDTTKKVSITLSCAKPGYTFEVYKVANLTTTSTSPYEVKYTSLVPAISSAVLSGSTATILKNLDALDTIPSTAPSQGTWTTSAASATKAYNNLSQGIYYIKAINYPAGVTSVTNSVVALPYYNNSNWVYASGTINLASKVVDDTPTTDKKITNSTKSNVNFTDVSLGDTVDFEIRSTTAGSSKMHLGSYTVYDNMSAGLTLDQSSVKVALLKADGTKLNDLDTAEYKVNITSSGDGENTVFNVALTSAYLDTAEFYGADVKYTSVTYSATLNKHAIVGKAGNPNEEIKLEYGNKNGVKSEVKGNTVYVYTYGITSNKIDQADNPLAGATFELYITSEDAAKGTNAIAKGVSDATGLVEYFNTANEKIKLQSGIYYAKETKAPAGYNIYDAVITVDLSAAYGTALTNGTYVTNCVTNGIGTFSVKDTKIVLPQTGGAGNVIVYTVSVIAFAGFASFLFLALRKKRNAASK